MAFSITKNSSHWFNDQWELFFIVICICINIFKLYKGYILFAFFFNSSESQCLFSPHKSKRSFAASSLEIFSKTCSPLFNGFVGLIPEASRPSFFGEDNTDSPSSRSPAALGISSIRRIFPAGVGPARRHPE